MSKNLLSLLLVLCITIVTHAQVGIGTTTPNAKLEVKSSSITAPNNKDGILIPQINNFPATNPTAAQDGMLVFATGNGTPSKGFYYWDSPTLTWIPLGGAKKINDLLDGKSDNDGTQNGSSVFLGIDAGLNDDSTDNRNVGVGFRALFSNTTGTNNAATGYGTLYSNTTGNWNTANGYLSLFANTTGTQNTANGFESLYSNTTGYSNTATGVQALLTNTTGIYNTASGSSALRLNTTGFSNTANGYEALYNTTTGNENVANGSIALYSNTTGSYNVANGSQSLYYNTIGSYNIANGYKALYFNTSGNNNTANGTLALYTNTSGTDNVANGYLSLYRNTIGYKNTASGRESLFFNTTGFHNTANGYYSLYSNTTGSYNTVFGGLAGFSGTNYDNRTALGYGTQNTASNQVRIGNSTVTSIGGFRAWTNFSDRRFKKNIKENVKGLDFILKLRPVTYTMDVNSINTFLKIPDSISNGKHGELMKYKREAEKEVQTGFIAQEVEQVAKQIGYNFNGVDKPKNNSDYYGLRYAEFVVPLVKGMQEQQKLIMNLKNAYKNLRNENKQQKTEIELLKKVQLKQKKRLDRIEKLLIKK